MQDIKEGIPYPIRIARRQVLHEPPPLASQLALVECIMHDADMTGIVVRLLHLPHSPFSYLQSDNSNIATALLRSDCRSQHKALNLHLGRC
jgi:hypothetical protein